MTTTEDRKTARAAGVSRPSDDELVDYLAISVSRARSGAVHVRRTKMDPASRRVVSVTLMEGQEARTSDTAMLEWLVQGVGEHVLDLEDQLRLW